MQVGCSIEPTLSELKFGLPAIETGKGRIFFYRDQDVRVIYAPDITVNGEVVGSVPHHKDMFYKDVLPGVYVVKTKATKEQIQFAITEGRREYVRFKYSGTGYGMYPELVERSIGASETQGMAFIGSR